MVSGTMIVLQKKSCVAIADISSGCVTRTHVCIAIANYNKSIGKNDCNSKYFLFAMPITVSSRNEQIHIFHHVTIHFLLRRKYDKTNKCSEQKTHSRLFFLTNWKEFFCIEIYWYYSVDRGYSIWMMTKHFGNICDCRQIHKTRHIEWKKKQ